MSSEEQIQMPTLRQSDKPIRSVDISVSEHVFTVATALRRLWLVDPESPALKALVEEHGDDLEDDDEDEHEHTHDGEPCQGHDHDHDHSHEHEHENDHEGCDGHDHDHDHSHSHGHSHGHSHDGHTTCNHDHSHDEPETPEEAYLHKALPLAFQTLATEVASSTSPTRYLDSDWKAATALSLINPSSPSPDATATTDNDADADPQAELFTPFREQIYGIYNNIFYDVYSSLVASKHLSPEKVQPPVATVMVLEAPGGAPEVIEHEFDEDTFVYPVWIAEGTKLTVKFGDEVVEYGAAGHEWTDVLWFKAGMEITMTPEDVVVAEGGEQSKGVKALLAMGLCEPVEVEEEEEA